MRLPARQRHLSDEGVEFIARFEGWRPYAYNDPVMHATVGFGHLIHHGPVTAADEARYGTQSHPKLTRAEGLALLRRDARTKAADPVRRLVKVPLSQPEFDALVSLVFNIGPGAFSSSTVLRELNRGHRRRAGLAFLMWNRAGGRVLLGLSVAGALSAGCSVDP